MDGDETGYIERYAAMCEIKQIEVGSTQPFLTIVLLKCACGKASYSAWHVSQEVRTQLVEYISRKLDLTDMSTILAGDIGMSFHYVASQAEKFSDQVEHCSLPKSALTLLGKHIGDPKLPHTVQDYSQN